MVRPRLYGGGDIHNRELWRRRIKSPMGLSSLHILSRRALRWEMRGSQFYRETFPEKIPRKFFGRRPSQGDKALRQIQTPFYLTRKALRNPRISHFALQGVQSLHRTKIGPQIAPFQLSACATHLRSDRHSRSHSTQNTPFFNIFLTAFPLPLVISETKSAILQD